MMFELREAGFDKFPGDCERMVGLEVDLPSVLGDDGLRDVCP